LNLEQRKLYDTVVSQCSNELAGQPLPQLLLHVDGVAGSRKTFVLLKTCARIQELAQEAGRQNPVFRAAPTGIAACAYDRRIDFRGTVRYEAKSYAVRIPIWLHKEYLHFLYYCQHWYSF
jgi:hypothetical protein